MFFFIFYYILLFLFSRHLDKDQIRVFELFTKVVLLTRSTAPTPAFKDGGWRRSELALSEVEGVNPEQAAAFRLGSRRVDMLPILDI